jgi:peroxiredoxin
VHEGVLHFRDLARSSPRSARNASASQWTAWRSRREFTTKNDLDYPLLADVDGNVAKLYDVKRALESVEGEAHDLRDRSRPPHRRHHQQ